MEEGEGTGGAVGLRGTAVGRGAGTVVGRGEAGASRHVVSSHSARSAATMFCKVNVLFSVSDSWFKNMNSATASWQTGKYEQQYRDPMSKT
mmetsp:Transcript_19171/g.37968  ORF Transcript_19171/g.37968 Transcript_19171/m.37968 type:complete len:91 (+) Transcript_19171:311-583(+)